MSSLLQRIDAEPSLAECLKDECAEKGVHATISSDIDRSRVRIIDVDKYYKNLQLAYTPPTPDCLIVLDCIAPGYTLTIAELKSTHVAQRLKVKDIVKSFDICLNDFIMRRCKSILNIKYRKVRLYLASKVKLNRPKKDERIRMAVFMRRPVVFQNKKHYIQTVMPDPAITDC